MDQPQIDDTDSREGESRLIPFKYGLQWLLILVFFIAILLSAHESGKRSGYEDGFEVGKVEGFDEGQRSMMPQETRAYRLGDLWSGKNAANGLSALMSEIQSKVAPKTWEANGGNATMAPYPQNQSLIVSQSPYGHAELVEFIELRRAELRSSKQMR